MSALSESIGVREALAGPGRALNAFVGHVRGQTIHNQGYQASPRHHLTHPDPAGLMAFICVLRTSKDQLFPTANSCNEIGVLH
ncbi:hypothetical protein ACA087_07795 [Pseudomonas chlororaphis]|uniref:hypothetical protein n=1 Tax=Pseudomonas chlororaphis TaxID=587753 RepID=UPI00352AEF97